MELLIVTGLSGAGKSQVGNALEDMGFYCVDNVPPAVIPAFVDMSEQSKGNLGKIALVTDVRGGQLFEGITDVLEDLDAREIKYKILFLDASDEVIIRRYRENRRQHPLNKEGKLSVGEAVKEERKALEKIRNRADFIIDTSHTSLAQLKQKVTSLFCSDLSDSLKIQCKSFGFKYGSDRENDLIFDVRCLPNPFYDEALKEKTGGIVQGMSGSPIIQNGMLVGAVTHVFVDNAAEGYGIFAQNMVETQASLENSLKLKNAG